MTGGGKGMKQRSQLLILGVWLTRRGRSPQLWASVHIYNLQLALPSMLVQHLIPQLTGSHASGPWTLHKHSPQRQAPANLQHAQSNLITILGSFNSERMRAIQVPLQRF